MKTVINNDYKAYEDFINGVPQAFDSAGTTLHTGRNTVKSFTVDGTELVVKRYKRPNIIQRIAYTFFKKSKAERAYIYAYELRKRGFNTPHEAAYIELRRHGLLSDSYFISGACNLPPLTAPLQRPGFDTALADSLAGFLVRLHEKGVLHGDLNLGNILYEPTADGGYTFWLIDTNRSHFSRPSYDECLDNLKRLTHYKPLLEYVTARYAAIRGWDAGKTSAAVMRRLACFERRKHEIGRVKKAARKIKNKKTIA